MYLDYGFTAGLAYKHDFQQDIANLQHQEQLDRQARITAENKAKMMVGDIEFGKAFDKYNSGRLTEYTHGALKQIGQMVAENPDLASNPMKWMVFQNMKKSLRDNPIIEESMRFAKNKQDYLDDVKKNPSLRDDEDYIRQAEEMNHYNEHGTTDVSGKENKEFVFRPAPPPEDLGKLGAEYGKAFKDFRINRNPGFGGVGAWKAEIEPSKLNGWINTFVEQNKRQLTREAKGKGFNSAYDYAYQLIRPAIEEKFDMGDYNASLGYAKLRAEKQEMAQRRTLAEQTYRSAPNGSLPPEAIEKAVGKPQVLTIQNGRGQKFDIASPKAAPGSGWTTMEYKVEENGKVVNKTTKAFNYKLYLTRDEAYDKGIIKFWNFGNETGKGDISEDWYGKATVVKDDNGEDAVVVDALYLFDEFDPVMEARIEDQNTSTKFGAAGIDASVRKQMAEQQTRRVRYVKNAQGTYDIEVAE